MSFSIFQTCFAKCEAQTPQRSGASLSFLLLYLVQIFFGHISSTYFLISSFSLPLLSLLHKARIRLAFWLHLLPSSSISPPDTYFDLPPFLPTLPFFSRFHFRETENVPMGKNWETKRGPGRVENKGEKFVKPGVKRVNESC